VSGSGRSPGSLTMFRLIAVLPEPLAAGKIISNA
jgi:hypothetical protein